MGDRLEAKTARYERLLADALDAAHVVASGEDRALAAAHREMAEAYLADGRHFREHGDPVNALAAFSYGHGWLDAGIRSGLLAGATDEEPRGV